MGDGARPARRVARAVNDADRLHARTAGFAHRVTAALATIAQACERGTLGVSFSGGKDSTVLLDLVRRVVPSAPAVWFDSGAELTGTADLAAYYGADRIVAVRSLLDMARYCGWWGYPAPVDRAATFDVLETIVYEPAARAADRYGLTVMCLGLRATESAGRRLNAATRGVSYHDAGTGRDHCCPLAWWTDADVWAYLASREIRYHPAYDAYARMGLPRRQWRVSPTIGGKGTTRGRVAVLKQIDPALWNRLAAEFPLWAAES